MKTGWWGECICLGKPPCREARGSPANPRFCTPVFSGAATDQPLICPGFFTPLYACALAPAGNHGYGFGIRCGMGAARRENRSLTLCRYRHVCRRGPKRGHHAGPRNASDMGTQWVRIPVLTGLPRTKPHPLQQPVPFEKMMVKCRTHVKNKQRNHHPGTDSMWNTRQVIPEVRQRPGGPTKDDRPGT